MLRLSISNGAFSGLSLERNLAAVAELGFGGFEFNMKSVEVEDDCSVYRAERLVRDLGLECLTVHAATLPVRDAVEVHRAVYYGRISADFAHRLGAPVLVVHSNVSRRLDGDDRLRLMGRVFGEVGPYAESLGLRLALENLSYASVGFGKNVAELSEVFGAMGSEDAGFTLDFCHAVATGVVGELLDRFGNRLLNVHLSNRGHRPFVADTAELRSFVGRLAGLGYGGPVTLELSRKCSVADVLATKAVLERVMGLG